MIRLKYVNDDVTLEGILESQDISRTKIKLDNGEVIDVDSELVSLVDIELTEELMVEYLEHIATHYTDAEIPDVERTAVDKVVEEIKKRLQKK